jgi:hypothetical protein
MNPSSLTGREACRNPVPAFHILPSGADADAHGDHRVRVIKGRADLPGGCAESRAEAWNCLIRRRIMTPRQYCAVRALDDIVSDVSDVACSINTVSYR